jgi:hypothetical protein
VLKSPRITNTPKMKRRRRVSAWHDEGRTAASELFVCWETHRDFRLAVGDSRLLVTRGDVI